MKYDIVLAMIPPWEPKRAPLGLAYIVEYLKAAGFALKVIDFNLELYNRAEKSERAFWEIYNINFMSTSEITRKMFDAFKDEIDKFVDRVLSFESKFIGFSVNIASMGLAGKIATEIKKKNRDKIIIFGGTGCFWENDRRCIFPEDMAAVDIIVVGEGEEALVEILRRKSVNFEGIDGVLCRKEDFLKPAKPRYIDNLDKLPFPKFEDFDLDSYVTREIPMVLSRGCIGRCVFCIDHLMCGSYRYRSADNVFEEIKYHLTVNKRSYFGFNDLICNGNLRQLERICDLVISNYFNIVWGSYAMIRKDMDEALLKKMRKAGCVLLCYGLESGSNAVLKKMNKYYTSEDAVRLIRATHKAGIQAAVNIIVGFPGETEEDFDQTLSFIRENRDYLRQVTNISGFVIMPPSKLGSNPSEYGVKLPLGGELGSYVDGNGLTVTDRVGRIRKTIYLVSNLGIQNVIINQPNLDNSLLKNSTALLLLPPARTDMPLPEMAGLYSFLREEQFNPLVYDFNIKLFNGVTGDLKYLWDYKYWYLWNNPRKVLVEISDSLPDAVFSMMNGIASLETNIFYFHINPENFYFSAHVAAILKKWLPQALLIFGGKIFKDPKIFKLIPADTADIFISANYGRTLCEIINGGCDSLNDMPGVAVYKDGSYQLSKNEQFDVLSEPGEDKCGGSLEGFEVSQYGNLRLPIT